MNLVIFSKQTLPSSIGNFFYFNVLFDKYTGKHKQIGTLFQTLQNDRKGFMEMTVLSGIQYIFSLKVEKVLETFLDEVKSVERSKQSVKITYFIINSRLIIVFAANYASWIGHSK